MYDPSLGGAQIHDLNPGFVPNGLFWTTDNLPGQGIAVNVNLGRGLATMQAANVEIEDYGTIGNALSGGPGIPGTVSFTVVWSGVMQRINIRNTDSPLVGGGFAGEFVRGVAQMAWTATVGDLMFASDPLATSSSDFAEIGHERNGVFFP